ncbi:MAG TPA: hypothetical protein VMU00_03780 [Steroidobacteraceae bacterium]|nr:hypothetical protein [Steroidobacteraceae bacterium]
MAEPRQGYALARLAARHGALARPAERAALGASRGADRYLEVLRQTHLLAPPESVSAHDLDAFELYLAAEWRASCAEVAAWHPPRWRAAYRWCARLADLGVLESLRLAGPPSGWALNDRQLAPIAAAAPDERPAALAAAGLAPLATAFAAGASLAAAWRAHWHALWPAPAAAAARRLLELEALWIDGAVEAAGADRRSRLAARLERHYRRCRGSPAAGFCELARRALDLEAWRGGFASRLYAPAALREGAS